MGVTLQSELPREKLEETKKFLTEFWNLEEMSRPAYHIGDVKDPDMKPICENLKEFFLNEEIMLKEQLQQIGNRVIGRDDYIPALFPYIGTGIFASAFGCEIIYPENEQPWTVPIITSASQVHKLKKPKITDGLLGRVLDLTKYMIDETDGQLPIRVTDIQGPLDTASLIWRYTDFFIEMYEHPKEVHMLLDMVTDLIIEFTQEQKRICGDLFVPNHCPQVWVPPDKGISISEDLIAVISPALYEEFGIPYNDRLSEAFDGIFIHSCGNFEFNYDNLLKTKKLIGIDFGVCETSYELAVEKLGGKTVLSARIGIDKELCFGNPLEYVKYVVENKRPDTSLFLYADRILADVTKGGDSWRTFELDEVYDYLEDLN